MAKAPPAARSGIPTDQPEQNPGPAAPAAAPRTFGPPAEHIARWEAAGELARAAEAKEPGSGEAVFRAELAKEPAVPLPPGYESSPTSARNPMLDPVDPDELQPGTALYVNPSNDPVKVVLMSGSNQPMAFRWKPKGGRTAIPVEYVGIMPGRAPQLVLLGQRKADPVDDGAT